MLFQKSFFPFRAGTHFEIVSVLVSKVVRSPVFGMNHFNVCGGLLVKGAMPVFRVIFPCAGVKQAVRLESEKRREPAASDEKQHGGTDQPDQYFFSSGVYKEAPGTRRFQLAKSSGANNYATALV